MESNNSGFRPSIEPPSGGGESPILDMWCVPTAWKDIPRTFEGRVSHTIEWQMTQVQVLKITEGQVHPLPVATVRIPYTDPATQRKPREGEGSTRWAVWAESAAKFIPAGESIDWLVGKRQRWEQTPHLLRVPNPDPRPDQNSDPEGYSSYERFINAPTLSWVVAEVEGATTAQTQNAAVELRDYLLELANGKTEDKFYEQALDDDRVMASPGMVSALSSRSFVGQMVTAGLLSVDADGVLHKA